MSSEAVAVGIDVGGTKLVAAAVTADGELVAQARRSSPTGDPDGLLALLAELADELAPGLPVGVGVPGLVTREGVLAYGPNIQLADVAVKAPLEARLGVPVEVSNDASVALLGELRHGAAQGAEHVVMLTVGTGIGGGIAIDGRLYEGATGVGAELGHITVDDGGRPCAAGVPGCFEAYASGTALGVTAEERLRAGAHSDGLAARLEQSGRLVGKDVTLAAEAGDGLAVDVIREAGRWLGIGLASYVNVLDPEMILVGGGATTGAGRWMLPEARAVIDERMLGIGHRVAPPVVEAQLGDTAGMIGAAVLVQEGRR